MTLGALLDAGLPLEELRRALGSLAVDGYHVHADRVLRAGVSATKFSVHEHAGAAARARDSTCFHRGTIVKPRSPSSRARP